MDLLEGHDAPQDRDCERRQARERFVEDLGETARQVEDGQPRDAQLVRRALSALSALSRAHTRSRRTG